MISPQTLKLNFIAEDNPTTDLQQVNDNEDDLNCVGEML